LKYFSKSSFGTFKLHEVRTLGDGNGPVNSLQKIGKTRFGTHWLAAIAIDPCLPFIRDLVISKTIKFKVRFILSFIDKDALLSMLRTLRFKVFLPMNSTASIMTLVKTYFDIPQVWLHLSDLFGHLKLRMPMLLMSSFFG